MYDAPLLVFNTESGGLEGYVESLLKEAAVKGRMPKTAIPIEEIELLTDELKRVKSKKDKGRFKVKKKKITATTLKTGGGGTLTGKKTSIPVSRLLPAAQEGGGGFNIGESFAKIAESVTSIAKTLTEKKKLLDKESAFDRRADAGGRCSECSAIVNIITFPRCRNTGLESRIG